MRHLSQALQDHDLIILRVIGEWWEVDLTGEDKKSTIQILSETLVERPLQQELEFLPPEEAEAIQTLVDHEGKVPLAQFSRQFGDIREMGPAALEREEPWLAPESPAEDLWYRGLIYKGFDETDEGVVEFIYMPLEFLDQFEKPAKSAEAATALSPSAPAPIKKEEGSSDSGEIAIVEQDPKDFETAPQTIIDDATTLLTLAQTGHPVVRQLEKSLPYLHLQNLVGVEFLVQLLEEMNLMRFLKEGTYRPTKYAAAWLRTSREEAKRALFSAWQQSDWNALHHVPTLSCEGSGWHNDPIAPRKALLAQFPRRRAWFEVGQLVQRIKETDPDFQRPNGNYDTWYIRDTQTGRFLSGFDQWEAIEGQLLHFIVHSPMFWLGMVDRTPTAIRPTDIALRWLEDAPVPEAISPKPLKINPEGTINVHRESDRFQRFQVGRFAQLQPATQGAGYTYRITPGSLAQAKSQGIPPGRVLQFLNETANGKPPAGLRRAIERWIENDVEARLEKMIVLRVADPGILDVLRDHPKTRAFLGESLGELAVAVRAADWQPLHAAAAQLGLLLDPTFT